MTANGYHFESHTYVWDVDTLSWVPWDGATGSIGDITIGSVDQGAAGTDPWLVEHNGLIGVTGTVIAVPDGGTPQPVTDNGGSLTIDASSLPLPTNAAKETGGNLAAILAALASVAVTGPLTDTQLRASAVPVSASTLPLPSGAATGAKQDTGNSSLASIDSKVATAARQDIGNASLSNIDTLIGLLWQHTHATLVASLTLDVSLNFSGQYDISGSKAVAIYVENIDAVDGLFTLQAQASGGFGSITLPVISMYNPASREVQFSAASTCLYLVVVPPGVNNIVVARVSGMGAGSATLTILSSDQTNWAQDYFAVDNAAALARLSAAAGGGYIRQDSGATIAKESGGNLAAIVTALASQSTQPLNDNGTSYSSATTRAPSVSNYGELRVVTREYEQRSPFDGLDPTIFGQMSQGAFGDSAWS